MFFKQFYLGCLAHASYMIGDERTGAAVVVDPQRDIGQYLDEARRQKLRIEHVFLTHFHADFVAGHLELRDAVGARIHLGARARAEYDFTPHADGECMELGGVRLLFLETPGHTPEGLCIAVYDLREDPHAPKMVLTGDTLFIGDVGRPDLMASAGVAATDLAGMLYNSLHAKLLRLPDATLVYPAHGAGSLCGKKLSDDAFSTIGDQKVVNYAVQPMSREEFIDLVTSDLPPAPQYFSYDAQLNRKNRCLLDETLKTGMRALPLEEVLAGQGQGQVVLDTRADSDFNAAHLRGAVQVGLGGKFASWAGSVLQQDRPLILITEPGAEQEAKVRLGRVGYDNVTGYLREGMDSLRDRPDLVVSTPCFTTEDLRRRLEKGDDFCLLDVRTRGEYRELHFKNALHIPLLDLAARLAEVPLDRPVLVHCATGYRSTIACSLLARRGHACAGNLLGGMLAVANLRQQFGSFLEAAV